MQGDKNVNEPIHSSSFLKDNLYPKLFSIQGSNFHRYLNYFAVVVVVVVVVGFFFSIFSCFSFQQVRVLTDLGMFSEAIKVLMGLLLGEKLPKISDIGFRTVESKKVT